MHQVRTRALSSGFRASKIEGRGRNWLWRKRTSQLWSLPEFNLNKRNLILAIIEQLETDLSVVKQAALATLEAATHEESKPENEYDTRGLEASYLAGAQAKRVAEIDQALNIFRTTGLTDFGPKDPVQTTALVEIEL